MQEDFHFYCVALLARGAGLKAHDALTVAYASQYVDDATESELMSLEIEGSSLKFDPVRSAYDNLKVDQGLESLGWSSQKRVFIPFHFIPPVPFDPSRPEAFSFVTEPGSPFARLLLDEAAGEKNRDLRLCRTGTALHTYADSWSHEGFSGRRNRVENDVEDVSVYNRARRRWERLGVENIVLDALPQIGHAEAGYIPDLAYQKWRCSAGASRRKLGRDNVEAFAAAARSIYDWLAAMDKDDPADSIPWGELESVVTDLFAGGPAAPPRPIERVALPVCRAYHAVDVRRRCQEWRRKAGRFFEHPEAYCYDRESWRREAVAGDTRWDDWSESDWVHDPPRRLKPDFWNSRWVNFHRAALRQRHLVLENLP